MLLRIFDRTVEGIEFAWRPKGKNVIEYAKFSSNHHAITVLEYFKIYYPLKDRIDSKCV